MYDSVNAAIILVPKWLATCSKLKRSGDTLLGTVHAKVVPWYVKEFRDVHISQEFANTALRYRADGTDMEVIPSLLEQRVSVQKLGSERSSDALETMCDGEDYLDFQDTVPVEEVAILSCMVSYDRRSVSARMVMRLCLQRLLTLSIWFVTVLKQDLKTRTCPNRTRTWRTNL